MCHNRTVRRNRGRTRFDACRDNPLSVIATVERARTARGTVAGIPCAPGVSSNCLRIRRAATALGFWRRRRPGV